MDFANPKWLNALLLVPALALLFFWGARQRAREVRLFVGDDLGEALAPGRSWRKSLLKGFFKVAAFAMLVLALARPQFGSQLVKVEREGIDLVIALDTSLSMLAEDMKPNRLEKAKQEIIDLIRGLKGDRVGIVAFAGDAFVLCPLTVDYSAALMFTQTADVDIVSKPGSALDKAIDKSLALFKESAKTDGVIILVTDGESHDGEPVAAAEKAAGKGIRIYTIGIGNPAGELIPLRGTDGAVEGYKKDRSGETVLTRLDEATLRDVAKVTGGQYLPATRQGLELKVLYREISGLDKRTIEGEFIESKSDRFGLFLAAAFLLLGMDFIVTKRGTMRNRKKGRVLHTGAMRAAIVLLVVLLSSPAFAGGIDRGRVKSGNQYYDGGEYEKALLLYRQALEDSTKREDLSEGVLYNQANALHMLGNYEEALGKYHESFSEDSLHAGRMFYNRANTLLSMGKPQEAIDSYIQALQYQPDDEETRHNLEVALRMKEQQEQQQQQQNQDQQNEQGDEEEQQQQNQDQQNQQGDEEQQQQQNQDQQDQQGEEQQQQQQNPQDSSEASPDQQQPVESIQLSKEDALRLLKLLEEREKELQKAKKKAAMKRMGRKGKDW